MEHRAGMWSRLRQRIFSTTPTSDEAMQVLADPESSQEDEVVFGTDRLELTEQMCLIEVAKHYMDEFFLPTLRTEPALTRGFALKLQMFVTNGVEPVYRSNMVVFYQDTDGQRKYEYLVSLIRFGTDEWRVFQVK
ncbi:hypothetical protein [Paenibacillus sp. FJAT-27812]|uniref:hypothetical protein n=1 Tax=Paenibacillus sp. FJAT-27812 TaxID=1684143 RepID=UPI0006A7EB09|nr:hypothetical protein [Paenibacillus sp. FJAT-27812]